MKNRPLKHKSENAFQFKSFHERISEVDVRQSVLYHVNHENEELNEHQSFFHQTMQKWSVLNLSEEYNRFQSPLRGIVTLSQLLHKKDFVFEHLLVSLDSATELSLQALLEFVVALARDLRDDFGSVFDQIFDKLIDLLNTKNPQQLEWSLLCLASLFKILRGFLRERLDLIFNRIVTLLCDENQLHVTNFATECFGFLARDTKKKRELVQMITKAVKQDPSLSTGCGRLIFEIMRGVNQQFHSCAKDFWNLLLLEMLTESVNHEAGFDPDVLFGILVQTVSDMLICIDSENLAPFWTSVFKAAESCIHDNEVKNEQTLHYILHLIGIAVEHQHNKCLQNSSQIIGLLIKILKSTESGGIVTDVMKIATIMMLSRNLNMTQLDASRLCKNVMAVGPHSRKGFQDFVLSMVEHATFENIVLPDYMKYFEKNMDTESLKVLTRIVTKKSLRCQHGIRLDCWKRFPVKLRTDHAKQMYSDILQGGLTATNRTDFLLVLILLPHVAEIQNDSAVKHIVERGIVSNLPKHSGQLSNEQYEALNVMVEAFVHIEYDNMQLFVDIIKKLLPGAVDPVQDGSINIISLCLAKIHRDKPQLLTKSLFEMVHSQLSERLGSVHHNVRILVIHMFSLFGHLESLGKYEDQTLFDLMYAIETIEPTVHTYRKKLLLLNKLTFDSKLWQHIDHKAFGFDAMRFVLSTLSINFKLLWDPASQVLQSYAEGFAVSEFWNVYKKQLDFALEAIHRPARDEEKSSDTFDDNEKQDEKIDYVNYRVQLLSILSKLNNVFETKNRDIVGSFFDFIESEYRVKQQKSEPDANECTPKATQKILIAYLNIFAKVKNPKTIFKSKQLYELFEELLTHRSFEVQKLALDCIFTYGNNAITPYKENLYRLSSDKTMKEEMLNFFTEDAENEKKLRCVVLDEHRQQVVPLVMRIIHTRMIQKVTPIDQKALILRFVGNFNENEINIFISFSFLYFEKLLQCNPLQTYHQINESDTCFEEDLPVHRIQVLMKLLDSIREQFGGLKDESFTQHLLHIKLCMDSVVLRMQHSTVKQLKSQALIHLVEFFDHFDRYEWTEEEIETVFIIYIQPQLEKLETECIHSPTPLLKLFIAWSKNPRYYRFLAKSTSDQQYDIKTTPLSHVISLLNGDKVSDTICQEIMKMIISMLTLDPSESEPIMIPNSQRMDDDQIADSNIGNTMLTPFFMDILQYIQKVLSRRRSISKDHLLVLSHIAEHAKNEESCDAITNMLLPLIVKRLTIPNADMDTIQQMHRALYCLMKMVPNPEKHIQKIGLLLELVQEPATRTIIVQMVKLMAERSGTLEHAQCATFIEDMNAMDKRWLGQPDYERRLGAFRSIDRIMQNGELHGMDLTVLFVHQCFYYLKTDSDMAIRENTNHFLRKVVISSIRKFGNEKKAETQYLLERVILKALMKGIKDKNDSHRNESIQLLGELSRECADYSTVLFDLHHFTDSENREIDFFDNITHLQIHRHRRALNRFCKIAQTLTKLPSTRTLVNFVLPIVSSYLCNETFRKKVRLTDAAGNCVALISRMLPWPSYKMLLKQYLSQMKHNIEYQKQLIRLVVSLLDRFHFDLSQGDLSHMQDIGGSTSLNTTDNATRDTNEGENTTTPNVDGQALAENDEDNEEQDLLYKEPSTISAVKISFKCETVLTREYADTVIYDISKILIPDLFAVINYKEMPSSIKPNERKERYQREKAEMLKIPVAIAIIKLLQKLPPKFMDLNFPKLLIKVVCFLKSNLKQVRSIARHTLKDMILAVGPSFLSTVLEYLTSILSRGFQVHVMVATVHTLLDVVEDQLTAEIMNDILQLVLSICINDIFGPLAKEKEVGSIASKTPEAKPSKKSFLTLKILAKKMFESSALDIIMPFKEIISKTSSRKVVLKVEEALKKIADGICSNTNISVESMLVFVFGIISESIPDLTCGVKKTACSKTPEDKLAQKRPDIYLIPVEPKRIGAFDTITLLNRSKTNAHVFVEMGLEILHSLMKKSQAVSTDHEAFLEPLVPILVSSMSSNHVKVTTLGIKCISSMLSSKLKLSSIEQHIGTILGTLLKLLHKYATNVVGRNDENFPLVKTAFTAIVTLLKHVKNFEISDDQLKMLLLYVEQDLCHNEKQHMTLILLRSIIGRKLNTIEMVSIIKKVAEMSITHENQKMREECRQIVLEYLLNYSLGTNIEHMLHFYVEQLEYETIAGRESAVQMLRMMFKSFPAAILKNKSVFFFLTVGVRLVNEESSECRVLVAECLESLLSRLDKTSYDELLDLTLTMLRDVKISHREMAAQLIIRMVNVEKESFVSRLDKVIPALLFTITDVCSENTGKFVRLKSVEVKEGECAHIQKDKDHSLIQTLNAFNRIFEVCSQDLTSQQHMEMIDELSYNLQPLLTHGHQWVRIGALKLLSFILKSVDFETVHRIINGEQCEFIQHYIYENPVSHARSLVLDMCSQLIPAETSEDVASLVSENLLLVANILKIVPLPNVEDYDDSKKINLIWLIRRIRYVIQSEVAKAPKSIILRKHMFQWMEAVVELLDESSVVTIAPSVLSPVTRELSDKDHLDDQLKRIVMRLGNLVKSKIGNEKYDEIYLHMQSKVHEKRVARLRAISATKVSNPVQAAKRKMAVKQRKKEAKKQKLDIIRNTGRKTVGVALGAKSKRRRMEDMFKN